MHSDMQPGTVSDMADLDDIHTLIRAHDGDLDKVRELRPAMSKAQQNLLDIAVGMMAEAEGGIGISHSGFALTCLPHKSIDKSDKPHLWRKPGYRTTLLVQSGYTETGEVIGVPYGSRARMILVYLQTQAVRNNSPIIELGRSLHAWMKAMGVSSAGGMTYKQIAEQARRISACTLTFLSGDASTEIRSNGAFIEDSILSFQADDERQPQLWTDQVRLHRRFFEDLRKHPVPILESALRGIASNSAAIDIYIWLAYRLHVLTEAKLMPWPALFEQFGGGYQHLRQFKQPFLDSLRVAMAAYPEARVTLNDQGQGIVLHPSAPPVPKIGTRFAVA
jgi:hypothetical protein